MSRCMINVLYSCYRVVVFLPWLILVMLHIFQSFFSCYKLHSMISLLHGCVLNVATFYITWRGHKYNAANDVAFIKKYCGGRFDNAFDRWSKSMSNCIP
jgi:hypothetical protein